MYLLFRGIGGNGLCVVSWIDTCTLRPVDLCPSILCTRTHTHAHTKMANQKCEMVTKSTCNEFIFKMSSPKQKFKVETADHICLHYVNRGIRRYLEYNFVIAPFSSYVF